MKSALLLLSLLAVSFTPLIVGVILLNRKNKAPRRLALLKPWQRKMLHRQLS